MWVILLFFALVRRNLPTGLLPCKDYQGIWKRDCCLAAESCWLSLQPQCIEARGTGILKAQPR